MKSYLYLAFFFMVMTYLTPKEQYWRYFRFMLGVFLAVIIPPAREEHALAWVIVLAALISCVFYYVPVLNQLSSGWVIIICAVLASSFAAVKWPVGDEEDGEA